MSLAAELAEGVTALGIELPADAQPRLLAYLELLHKWNRIYNLTAVREPSRMVSHHLLDCLSVVPHLAAETLLDVGSGAGLPGIPIALARPRMAVTLIESSQKKAAFLQQAKLELALANVDVVCERVESWQPARGFDVVISRAFSDLAEFVAVAARHAVATGRLAAMKGVYPHEEIARLPEPWRLHQAIALAVPGLRAQRHLILLERA